MINFKPHSNAVSAKRMMGDKLLHLLIVGLLMTKYWRLWMKCFMVHLDEQPVEDHITGGRRVDDNLFQVVSHPTSYLPTQVMIYGIYAIDSFTKSGGYA
jgi:hypothetical protein